MYFSVSLSNPKIRALIEKRWAAQVSEPQKNHQKPRRAHRLIFFARCHGQLTPTKNWWESRRGGTPPDQNHRKPRETTQASSAWVGGVDATCVCRVYCGLPSADEEFTFPKFMH